MFGGEGMKDFTDLCGIDPSKFILNYYVVYHCKLIVVTFANGDKIIYDYSNKNLEMLDERMRKQMMMVVGSYPKSVTDYKKKHPLRTILHDNRLREDDNLSLGEELEKNRLFLHFEDRINYFFHSGSLWNGVNLNHLKSTLNSINGDKIRLNDIGFLSLMDVRQIVNNVLELEVQESLTLKKRVK